MGMSRSGDELAAKLYRLAGELSDSRRGVNAAALAAKEAMIAAEGDLAGGRVAGGRVGVRYDIMGQRNPTALVGWYGPAHLVLNPTAPHEILPRQRSGRGRRRGKRALTIAGDVRARAEHPGTTGRDPGATGGKAAAALVAPRAYAAELRRALLKVFG